MNKRNGRVSEAEKEINEVINSGNLIEVLDRPEPPANFNFLESEVWQMVVDSMPSGWFPEASFPVLSAYCKNTVAMDNISELITVCTQDPIKMDINLYLKLVRSQKEVSSVLASLATKLRITQQSTVTKQGVPRNNENTHKKPWE